MNTPVEKKAKVKVKSPSAGAETAEKYATMIVGIGKSREELHKKLTAKADSLGVKVGHIVWALVEKGLDALVAGDISVPVTNRAIGGVVGVGSAPGFWTVPVLDGSKVIGVEVVEVAKRPDASGREFYRYTVDETDAAATAKLRLRALGQATRGAQADLKFLGFSADVKPVVKELPKA